MAQRTVGDVQRPLAQAERELSEALERQAATDEVLRVISTSRTDVQPVFEMIVRSAVALCGSLFANVFRFDGELLHFVASHNVGPSYVELLRAKYPMRPDFTQVSGRVLLTKSVVRLEDVLTMTRDFPRPWAGGECLECRCCAMTIRSELSSSAGPKLDQSQRSRKNF